MFQWLREWMELRAEFRERTTVCQSCEILKTQLDTANRERAQLLSKLLDKEPESERTTAPAMETMPLRKHIPWRVKQQMLEAEDRAKAKALRNAAQPDAPSVEDLERDLDVVATEREGQSGKTAGIDK